VRNRMTGTREQEVSSCPDDATMPHEGSDETQRSVGAGRFDDAV